MWRPRQPDALRPGESPRRPAVVSRASSRAAAFRAACGFANPRAKDAREHGSGLRRAAHPERRRAQAVKIPIPLAGVATPADDFDDCAQMENCLFRLRGLTEGMRSRFVVAFAPVRR